MITESNSLNQEKKISISNFEKTFSKQNLIDSGIY